MILRVILATLLTFVFIYRMIGLKWIDAVYFSTTTHTSMGPESVLVDMTMVDKNRLKLVQIVQNTILIFLFLYIKCA